ncbi:MAG: T9SS type A sorting domain-containing protein [Bacteroidales bacterium]|nr:T9SS type A sorting domain-containing protein [Bacteroidales bacterium]
MKKSILIMLFSFTALIGLCQPWWDITFDDPAYLSKVILQPETSGINCWQIGHPQKTVFNTAYSPVNVMVTDTVNAYPVNDTSSFIITHLAGDGWHFAYPKIDITGWYYVNSDSLTDYGFIEFSLDHGITWLSVDSAQYNGCCTWGAIQDKPVLTGNSYDWKPFSYCICPPSTMEYEDTVLYKFTFVSDGIDTQKDGLMFDNLHFEDWAEGIPEPNNAEGIKIYPNPVSNYFFLELKEILKSCSIEIADAQGRVVLKINRYNKESVDVSHLPAGIYSVKVMDGKSFSVKKFLIRH